MALFHSDRKVLYTALAFRQFLDSLDVVQSLSKEGTDCKTYHFLQELHLSVFEYIEIPNVYMAPLACLLPIRLNFSIGSKPKLPLSYFPHSSVYCFNDGP